MRPKLNWDGYKDASGIFAALTIPISVEILRMIASNAYGMTEDQIIDNSRYDADLVGVWVSQLYTIGLLVKKTFPIVPGGFVAGEIDYYQCNWKQIKRVNKAISQL